MFKVTRYPHGTFCWVDLSSTNQAAAEKFYTELMGWTVERRPIGDGMDYLMFKAAGEYVAGASQAGPDGPPVSVWNHYVNVENVDALVDPIKAAGGTILVEPFEVLDQGRMLIIQDPTGAALSLWQANKHIGSGLVNTAGAVTWNELATRDPQAAMTFFGKVFGWEFQPAGNDYQTIQNKGRMNGGIIPMTEQWGDLPPHWMVYFSVADLDATVARVEELGGSISVPITDIPEMGRFAVVRDPGGAVFTLMHVLAPDPWVE